MKSTVHKLKESHEKLNEFGVITVLFGFTWYRNMNANRLSLF